MGTGAIVMLVIGGGGLWGGCIVFSILAYKHHRKQSKAPCKMCAGDDKQ